MNFILFSILILLLLPLAFKFIFIRQNPISTKNIVIFYSISFVLPLVIPYPWIEKITLDYFAGLGPAFLSTTLILLLELFLAFLLSWLLSQRLPLEHFTPTNFFLFPLLGLGFGLGKMLRDILLVYYHPLSSFYGYSQFANFPTTSFLIQKLLQAQIETIAFGILGIAFLRMTQVQKRNPFIFFLLALGIKELENLARLLPQFVPSLAFLSAVYLISLLPLTLIIGLAILWFLYQREKRSDQLLSNNQSSS
ncbi:MAG: hypothetical protein PWP04_24 [Candidatus Atribacteria bacterium]|nr:hypothetical protein [Candidatus Atribacteria bacterium]